VSIGIVEITSDTPTVASVMSAADVACYSAKDMGRNRVQLYKPDDVPARHREMHWVSKLSRACDESRFELFYQPIVPIGATAREHEREHFELMLRLRDESGALITPAEFIPAAERYNVMSVIDRWVVQRAIERLKWDVLYNAGAGCEILARMMQFASMSQPKFDPVLISSHLARSAYAGYNGGPGACNRWRRREPAALKQIDSSFLDKYEAVENGTQIDILSCASSWGH